MSIQIAVPGVDILVQDHSEDAEREIGRMTPSRSYGSDTNLSCWRRALTAVNLNGTNGYAFEGHSLKPQASATLGYLATHRQICDGAGVKIIGG